MKIFDINGTELNKGDLIVKAKDKYAIEIVVVKSLFYSKAYSKITGVSVSKKAGERYHFTVGKAEKEKITLSCLKYNGPHNLQPVIDWVMSEAWECEVPKSTTYNARVLANLTRAISRAKTLIEGHKKNLARYNTNNQSYRSYGRSYAPELPKVFQVKVLTHDNRGRGVNLNFFLTPEVELQIQSTITSPSEQYDIPTFCQKFDVDMINVIERVDKIKEVLRTSGG